MFLASTSGGYVCRFGDCHQTIDTPTTAGVRKHFLDYHRADPMEPGERIRCRWDGCPQRPLKKAYLARHIATKHLRIEEVECGISGCKKVFSRKDARKRHVKRAHGEQATL